MDTEMFKKLTWIFLDLRLGQASCIDGARSNIGVKVNYLFHSRVYFPVFMQMESHFLTTSAAFNHNFIVFGFCFTI